MEVVSPRLNDKSLGADGAWTDGYRVQPHWTSAYDGYGTSSLDTDVGELSALVEHLRKEDGEYINGLG